MPNNQPLEIVIIGLGASALYASKSALSFNHNCHVTIIEKRSFDQFSPCGLPWVIKGVIKDFDELKYDVPEIKNKLTKLLHHEAVFANKGKKIVKAVNLETSKKIEVSYDVLILATGASPIIPPIPGANDLLGKGVHFLSNIDNSNALLEAAQLSKTRGAVVVGAGAIGLEVAVALRSLGLTVTLIEKMPFPLPRNIEPLMGKIIVGHLEKLGIKVLLEKELDRINGTNEVKSVEIAGQAIACDIVVMAVGMKGNSKLAEIIGAKIENGAVVVNNRMETSIKDVYAVGDSIQTHSRIDGTPTIMQLATAAYRQGMVAGTNAAGGNTYYPGALNTFLTVVSGLEIASTGYSLEMAKRLGYDALAISTKRGTKPHYMPDVKDINLIAIVDTKDGKILGAQAVGEQGAGWRINIFALAIQGGMTLYDLMDAELSYNPPVSQMYDPISQIAEIGLKRLKLPPKECKEVFFPEKK